MNCPSCAAPLDPEGVCTACGALSRGFFRGLDLGAPQIAAAVSRGLDFYRLLGIAPDATTHQVARRYRQLRVLFPDNPAALAPDPARRLALLEAAGRALTDPALRRVYDELRAGEPQMPRTEVLRCAGCTAPLPAGAGACPYCGTPRPAEPAPPPEPPAGGPPPAEPVDYYSLIALHPAHLTAAAPALAWGGALGRGPEPQPAGPPEPADVDAAAYAREREALLSPGLTPEGRERRADEIDLARRILRDERRRSRYDVLWRAFEQGALTAGYLEALAALQAEARAEQAAARGEQPDQGDADELLRQGLGLLRAGLPREAAETLRAAVAAAPRSAEAHAGYARALLASGDPLDLAPHALRQALGSLEAARQLGAALPGGEALAALCRGLLARDAGDAPAAEAALRDAARLDSGLAAAWRGLAALALARGAYDETLDSCRRALAADRADGRALLMAAAACLRARRPAEAREAAAQAAALRGPGCSAEDVLREIA